MAHSLTQQTDSTHTFTEWVDEGAGMIWRISEVIETVETPYQRIELFDTPSEGKLLVHDGAVMLSERFEATYHEMLVHPASVVAMAAPCAKWSITAKLNWHAR